MNNLLTVEEVAEFLRVSPLMVYRLANKGIIKSIKVGSLVRIPKEELENFIQRSKVE